MIKRFQRIYIDLTCMQQDNDLKDIFKICSQVFNKLKNYNYGFHVIQLSVRDNFDFECDGQAKGFVDINVSNKYLKVVNLIVDKNNLSYNIYHSYGHFLQKYIFDEQKIQEFYKQYLQKLDVFNLHNYDSISKNECIPQLVALYFLNKLNKYDKKIIQEKIFKI